MAPLIMAPFFSANDPKNVYLSQRPAVKPNRAPQLRDMNRRRRCDIEQVAAANACSKRRYLFFLASPSALAADRNNEFHLKSDARQWQSTRRSIGDVVST
jgi:hypothetical protein